MIDHISLPVSDIARATEFYLKALAPLGIAIVMQVSAEESGHGAAVGFGANQSRSSGLARASGSAGMSMSPSSRHRARRSMPSIEPRSRPAARTTARLGCGRITTPIITAPSCSISTATISRRCVISPRKRGYLAQRGRENSQVGTPSLRISSCFFGSFSACQS